MIPNLEEKKQIKEKEGESFYDNEEQNITTKQFQLSFFSLSSRSLC